MDCRQFLNYVMGGGFLASTLLTHAAAEAPYQVAWSRSFGAVARNNWSFSVAIDAAGYAYTAGFTEGRLGGPSAGGRDAFLAKFDKTGDMQWVRQFGTNQDDQGWSVAVDPLGNAYISGHTEGSLFGPNSGGDEAFVAKFDAFGNPLWSQQFAPAPFYESTSIAVDSGGNVYASGARTGSPGTPKAGHFDTFLVKFDPSGNTLWSQQFGSDEGDELGTSVAVDGLGNAYISGNRGQNDAFLIKYDSSGSFLWSQSLGAWDGRVASQSITVDSAGNVYMSGFTFGSLDGSQQGNGDAFLAKFDASGNPLWTRQLGTPYRELSSSVNVDPSDNPYITGHTRGKLGSTDEGGFTDVFLAKYDTTGNFLWSHQISGPGFESGNSLAVNSHGSVYVSGSAGSYTQMAFLTKFVPEPATLWPAAVGLAALSVPRRRRRIRP